MDRATWKKLNVYTREEWNGAFFMTAPEWMALARELRNSIYEQGRGTLVDQQGRLCTAAVIDVFESAIISQDQFDLLVLLNDTERLTFPQISRVIEAFVDQLSTCKVPERYEVYAFLDQEHV